MEGRTAEAYSFMRSKQPSPVSTAWCVLLERQGGRPECLPYLAGVEGQATAAKECQVW